MYFQTAGMSFIYHSVGLVEGLVPQSIVWANDGPIQRHRA